MFTNLWRKIRGARSVAASNRLRASRKSRRLFFEPLENRKLLATITVTGIGDTIDAADGLVTLREAITAANTNAASGDAPAGDVGLDTIAFNIPGSGVHAIMPTSALPPIADPIFINGYTQPKNDGSGQLAKANDNGPGLGINAVPLIELDGTTASVGSSPSGLVISAGNSTVRGLVINRFLGRGILLSSEGNVIAGNFIGTSAAGDADLGNGSSGVEIDASNNTIGGTALADRNLISGNDGNGVHIFATASAALPDMTGNEVLGNLIGTDKAGTKAIGNSSGVRLEGVPGRQRITDNLIGGTTAAARNVISGSTGSADILVSGPQVFLNRIQGNFIGTDVTGTAGLAGAINGVNLSTGSFNNLIGGDDAADGIVDGIVGAANVISGHPGGGAGVRIDGGTSGNHVEGNRIGTNAAGTAAIPNGVGVLVEGAAGNAVGGAAPGAGNLISGNSGFFGHGIQVIGGTGNSILGNSIFANGRLGIDLSGGTEDAFFVTKNDDDSPPCTAGHPDCDTGANNLQNFPVLTSAVTTAGVTTITGTLNSTPSSSFRIEFFSNTAADPSLHGEGQTLLKFSVPTDVMTDANGDASFSFSPTTALDTGLFLSATATKLEDTDQDPQTPLAPTDTSEFSGDVCSADQFTVVNTNDSGPGSLRQAIINANNHTNTGSPAVPDKITFCIPGSGVHTITPSTSLPDINEKVTIDGYTQEGASENTNAPGLADNALLRIEISWPNNIVTDNGFTIGDSADGSKIRGLVINGFPRGIEIQASNVTIEGNFIGVDPTGASARPNGTGIDFAAGSDTSNGHVGGMTPDARNVISGNGTGIVIDGDHNLVAGTLIVVEGNLIGTDATGIVGIPNQDGVDIRSSNNLVGGSTLAARNVINGSSSGVQVVGAAATGNQIQGNFIQVLGDGVTPGTSANTAIFLENNSSNTQVGGLTNTPGTGPGNVIGAGFIGIQMSGSNNKIQGNLIGTDVTGTKAVGISTDGIAEFGGEGNTIGGPTADARNAISACGGRGILISQGLTAFAPHNIRIQNNVITGNGSSGIEIDSVGTTTAILDNSIFANGGLGIDLGGDGKTDNDESAFPFDTDPGPNNLQNFPDLASVTSSNGTTTIQGTLKSTASTQFQIEFFANTAADPSGNGEGQTFLGSVTITDGGAGDTDPAAGIIAFSFQTPTPTETFFTATATRTNGEDVLIETSEFSDAISPAAAEGVDLAVSKSDSPDPVIAGNNLTYTITVSNAGASAAQLVSLSDAIPANTTFVSVTTPIGWTRTDTTAVGGTGTITETTPTLAGGASATFTFVVHVNSNTAQGATINNTATVATTSDETDTTNNSASATTTVNVQADLSVTKTDSPDPVTAGNNLTYTITVTNGGPSDASNVSLADVVPANTTFVSATQTSGASFSLTKPSVGSGGTLSASASTLAAGASASFTLVVHVNASTPDDTTLTNTATVTSSTNDTNANNNSATASTTVIGTTDLSVNKADNPDPVTAGQNLIYTITVSNAGGTANGVTLSDAVPTGTTFVSANQTAGSTFMLNKPAVGSTGSLSASISSLAGGAIATFTMVVRVSPSATSGAMISNTTSVNSTTSDTNTANNSDTETTSVATLADLTVMKTDSPDSVAPGGTLTYTLVISNLGPSDAQGVSLSDAIPFNTTFVSATQISGSLFMLTTPSVGGTGTFTASTATLAANASATFTLVVSVDSATPIGTTISNSATATTTTTETNTANNTGTADTEVNEGLPECDISTLNGPDEPGTAVIVDDADNPGSSVLLITGTSKTDVIVVEPQPRSQGILRVVQNKHVIVTFISRDVQRIVIYGMEGNDKITISPALFQPAIIFGGSGNDVIVAGSGDTQVEGDNGNDKIVGGRGNDTLCGDNGNDVIVGGLGNDVIFGEAGNDVINGSLGDDLLLGGDGNDVIDGAVGDDHLYGQAGNDTLVGGVGNNILVGGDGNDKIVARPGRNILIGGDGADTLTGNVGDDILIGGSTAYDEDDAALQAILDEWSSSNSYNDRVNNIRFGGGANGAFVLDDTTVFDDGVRDTLIGSAGQDWFWAGANDKLKDRKSNEQVN